MTASGRNRRMMRTSRRSAVGAWRVPDPSDSAGTPARTTSPKRGPSSLMQTTRASKRSGSSAGASVAMCRSAPPIPRLGVTNSTRIRSGGRWHIRGYSSFREPAASNRTRHGVGVHRLSRPLRRHLRLHRHHGAAAVARGVRDHGAGRGGDRGRHPPRRLGDPGRARPPRGRRRPGRGRQHGPHLDAAGRARRGGPRHRGRAAAGVVLRRVAGVRGGGPPVGRALRAVLRPRPRRPAAAAPPVQVAPRGRRTRWRPSSAARPPRSSRWPGPASGRSSRCGTPTR